MNESDSKRPQAYRVAWFVGPRDAVPEATVLIEGRRLVNVERSADPHAINLGDVAFVPGLVNAHTHLEFSLLTEPIPTTGRFTDWIRSVVSYRREHPDVASNAIRAGLDESIRSGTTWIGDIATTGWTRDDYLSRGVPGAVFQELLGLTKERVDSQGSLARRSITDSPTEVAHELLSGLSPHAPYSVHPELLRTAIQLARQSVCPLAMHLAETEAELELLAEGTGEFREMLEEFGIWSDGLFLRGRRPIHYLEMLAEAPAPLVIHGNYLGANELRFLAERPHMTLVYCPRTHAAFSHRDHPWRRLLELGGSVAIGTDSKASNPDLSIFAELQFLAQANPDLSHLDLLKLATGQSLRRWLAHRSHIDAPADLTAIRLSPSRGTNLVDRLFAPDSEVVGTMINGHWRSIADSWSSLNTSG